MQSHHPADGRDRDHNMSENQFVSTDQGNTIASQLGLHTHVPRPGVMPDAMEGEFAITSARGTNTSSLGHLAIQRPSNSGAMAGMQQHWSNARSSLGSARKLQHVANISFREEDEQQSSSEGSASVSSFTHQIFRVVEDDEAVNRYRPPAVPGMGSAVLLSAVPSGSARPSEIQEDVIAEEEQEVGIDVQPLYNGPVA